MTIANSRGANGHPCLTALCISTSGVIMLGSLVRIASLLPLCEFMTYSTKSSGAPIFLSACSMLAHGSVSYALLIS